MPFYDLLAFPVDRQLNWPFGENSMKPQRNPSLKSQKTWTNLSKAKACIEIDVIVATKLTLNNIVSRHGTLNNATAINGSQTFALKH